MLLRWGLLSFEATTVAVGEVYKAVAMHLPIYIALAIQLCGITNSQHNPRDEQVNKKTYDYIVVGGGTTGLVVANRLTENPRSTSSMVASAYTVFKTPSSYSARR